ncbi:hypothetical protein Airi02_088990 [Actinoallomurus iriomotensis]|uniref:Uncharacterized protein n=1 Tax=Actinoallomurus iriomotensis TaxID=478107 RepID=A0A9W6SE20_9ACTN|nr:hypothetical protein Airi02_088990 [Actinoallomurus iriomotensis]
MGILEGAAMIEPRLGPAASALRSIAYENAVRRALERVLPDGGTVTATEPPADFAVLTPTANLLISVVFRRSRNIQMVDLAPLVSSRQLEGADGGLVVANQALSSGVSEYIATAAKHGVMIEVVNWDGPEHDRDLRQAVSRLLRQADPA